MAPRESYCGGFGLKLSTGFVQIFTFILSVVVRGSDELGTQIIPQASLEDRFYRF